jgi:hypothetical protein
MEQDLLLIILCSLLNQGEIYYVSNIYDLTYWDC